MSTIISPGFEVPNGAWTLVDNASFVSTPKHTGALALRLATILGLPGSASQTGIEVVVGRRTPLQVWTHGDAAGSCTLTCVVSDSGISTDYTLSAPLGPGWQLWEIATLYPNSTTIDIVFLSGPLSGVWFCDDIAMLDQHYPPENGPYKRGQTWHVDDIMGTMMPLDATYRDDDRRLVDSRMGVDEPGRDELLRHYKPPIEILRRDP